MKSRLGDHHDKLKKEFAEKLLMIETKHADILTDKINRYTDKPPDKLKEHYNINYDHRKYQLDFRIDSDLPDYIRDEITVAFVSIFSDI